MKTIRSTAIPAFFGLAFAAAVPMSLAHAQGDDRRPQQQKPSGGTVKGAAAGAIAGHVPGGHTETGAAVGAVAGHHRRAKSEGRIRNGGEP